MSQPRILTYGHDDVLLQTRVAILNKAGLSSDQSSSCEQVMKSFINPQRHYDLVILCHSVPAKEKESIVAEAERLNIKIYALREPVRPEHFTSQVRELAAVC